jgi:hypothetical protein
MGGSKRRCAVRKMIRVGNLDRSTSKSDLEQLCSAYGRVRRVRFITKTEKDDGGGVGIVEMESEQECAAAIAALGGRSYRGRTLTAWQGRPRNAADAAYPGMCGTGGAAHEQKVGTSDGPSPGGFGDRGGKGSSGGQFHI